VNVPNTGYEIIPQ